MTLYNDTRWNILRELLACPTAPYREQHVRSHIAQFCADRNIAATTDTMGNLIAVYGRGHPDSRLAFCAHMDHPGFIVTADATGKTAAAVFYGGVENSFFDAARVRIFTGAGPIGARVLSVRTEKQHRRKRVRLSIDGPVRCGDIGMWDLPKLQLRNGRLISRACDDLVGCAALLELLDHLHHRGVRKKVTACFTVAEEAGLHGAKHLCLNNALPSRAWVLSIETSAVLPAARMNDGVVIRVGDRAGIFDPTVTDFLLTAAATLQTKDKTFRFQRKLMDAGTCEATVFSRFGYACGAMCIPLGNYHNRNRRIGRIGAEFVSADDYINMVKLFIACVASAPVAAKPTRPRYDCQTGDLGEQFYW